MKGCFWPTWRWVNSFFDFCPIPHTFLTFFESPKKLKLPFFELETWFFVWRDVFDQLEHMSTHFLILALLRSKMALWSWAVYNIKSALSKQKCLWLYTPADVLTTWGLRQKFRQKLHPGLCQHIHHLYSSRASSIENSSSDSSQYLRISLAMGALRLLRTSLALTYDSMWLTT